MSVQSINLLRVREKENVVAHFTGLATSGRPLTVTHVDTQTRTHTHNTAYYISTCAKVYNDAKLQWLTVTMLGSTSASAALSNDSMSKRICHGNHWPVCICPELKHQDFSIIGPSFMEVIRQQDL